MRPISSGVASGGTLALALKALNWFDRADPWTACQSVCAVSDQRHFDWFAFALGLATGAFLCALLELIFTLRIWISAFVQSVSFQSGSFKPEKPLYKLL